VLLLQHSLTQDTIPGGVGPIIDCTGTSSGDTTIVVFVNHADAVAFAQNIISGASAGALGPAGEVVGPDWAVNTSPSYATEVQRAIGGQLMKAS
jgi:hypothetical protein